MNSNGTTSAPAALPLVPPVHELRGVPLGTILWRLGVLPAETIDPAIPASEACGKRLGRYLVERGELREDALALALAMQRGFSFVDLARVAPEPEALALVSGHTARSLRVLPLALAGGAPVVAVGDPTCAQTAQAVREALGEGVVLVVADPDALGSAIAAAYAPRAEAPVPDSAPEPVRVVLCLCTGEQLEVETADATAADRLVRSLRAAACAWPRVGDRFLRPGAIVSVEIEGVPA